MDLEPTDATNSDQRSVEAQRLEAWLSLPASDRAELLDGRIVYRTSPSIERGDAILGVVEQIGRFRGPSSSGDGGWWLSRDVDLYLSGQGLRPDLVGWRIDRYPTPPKKVNVGDRHLGVYDTAPDLVCEVLSESTRGRDRAEGVKWRAYFDAQVDHYWLVDLTRGQLLVYRRREQDYQPIDVAGRDSVKPLEPFATMEFHARRVFMLAEIARAARGG